MPKIVDAFPFFNEKDILEIRLNELDPVVDMFVLVEATFTHSGLPKPLYFDESKYQERFAKFSHKILHIIVEDMPITPEQIQASISQQDRKWLDTGYQLGDNWVRERYQRNQIMQGLLNCQPNDIIIIEDADEMVKPELLFMIDRLMADNGSNAVGQEFRTCYMNWKCTNMPWWGSKILRNKLVTNPSEHRFHTPALRYFEDMGWHFNFWGGEDAIKQKITSYAHQEFNTPDVLTGVKSHLKNKTDVLGRQYQYEVVPIDGTLPKYLVDNLDRFQQYVYHA